MKDTYIDGKKLARNGQKTATYLAASFLSHYRRILFSNLLVFNLWNEFEFSVALKNTSVSLKVELMITFSLK